ncbi:MAG: phosphatidylinositol mannoside acyltransferase, partial [Candidatus Nanopelagicales bacterium]
MRGDSDNRDPTPSIRSPVFETMTTAAYWIAWRIVRFLPIGLARRIFAWLGIIAYHRGGKLIEQLRKNLEVVTGKSGEELEVLVKAGLVSYGRYWAEAFQLPSYSDSKVNSLVDIKNPERLLEPLKHGQGVVVAVAHLANWDLAGRWFAMQAGEVITVAERLKPTKLFEAFLRYRKSIGLVAYPAKDRATVPALKQALEAGKLVALVADRDMSSSGIEVQFCGETCTMPAGPASLAYATNSVLTTACLFNTPSGLGGYIDEPIVFDMSLSRDAAIRQATQEMADRFTKYVQSH